MATTNTAYVDGGPIEQVCTCSDIEISTLIVERISSLQVWLFGEKIKLVIFQDLSHNESDCYMEQEGFLRCQTPNSTVRLKVEGCRVKNVGCWIESEEWRV